MTLWFVFKWLAVALAAVFVLMAIALPLGVLILVTLEPVFDGFMPNPGDLLTAFAATASLVLVAAAFVSFTKRT